MLEPWVVVWSLSPHSCFPQLICMGKWDILVLQSPPHHTSSPPWLSVSDPSTSWNESFFFNSLDVGLPYSLIFWQLWFIFVSKLVVILLLVVRGSKAYLPIPPYLPDRGLTFFTLFMDLKIFYLFIFRQKGKGEKKRDKHQCVVASHAPPTGDLACNPGMCSDWE